MLFIQDFSFSQSYSIHEAMIRACSSSIAGYGAYAFASSSGVDILLKDKEFDALLDRGNYSMVVGIDQITNLACLETLSEIKHQKPSLDVHAFCHNDNGSLFHPKISFFKNEEGTGSLIVGSGNLTLGGLRKNREAFGAIELSQEELQRMEVYWQSWLAESADRLKDINDEEVINKAKENRYVRKPGDTARSREEVIKVEQEDQTVLKQEGWQYYKDSKVLLAEIPKSGNRWKQANFDIKTFSSFFGATPGDNSQRILLRSLNDDTTMAPIEIRPSVSVKSQNYRFELDAASGLLYPANGKPIGIFIQLTTRMFLYHLFMPSHPNYQEIMDWMDLNWHGRSDRMKRIVSTADELNNILSKTVFHQYMV